MDIRSANEAEIGALARLWYDGWQDAHARIVPAKLARLRTLESFAQRLQTAIAQIRVAGEVGNPGGFCIVKKRQSLSALYLGPATRFRSSGDVDSRHRGHTRRKGS